MYKSTFNCIVNVAVIIVRIQSNRLFVNQLIRNRRWKQVSRLLGVVFCSTFVAYCVKAWAQLRILRYSSGPVRNRLDQQENHILHYTYYRASESDVNNRPPLGPAPGIAQFLPGVFL